ncbi:hypothetical protein L1281_002549 [Neisseria sp. HSC-16F19]|nr:hypothetical protein [Neisseria sp. HSC-16F19]MCP2041931.1 hypothetical protein [Neisseria sp. HSC-16F19]
MTSIKIGGGSSAAFRGGSGGGAAGGAAGGSNWQDYLGIGTQIMGLIGQGVGSFYSARSQKRQLEMQAFMAELNGRRMEKQAQQALRAGEKEAVSRSLQAGQLKGSQRAALAANGVDLGVGSAAELQAGTDYFKEADMNQLAANALADAWGYRMGALNETNSARMARAQASTVNPMAAVHQTLLTGAGKVAESWSALRKNAWSDKKPAQGGGTVGGLAPAGDPIYALYLMNNGWK